MKRDGVFIRPNDPGARNLYAFLWQFELCFTVVREELLRSLIK
jgi:hypothetical protein